MFALYTVYVDSTLSQISHNIPVHTCALTAFGFVCTLECVFQWGPNFLQMSPKYFFHGI